MFYLRNFVNIARLVNVNLNFSQFRMLRKLTCPSVSFKNFSIAKNPLDTPIRSPTLPNPDDGMSDFEIPDGILSVLPKNEKDYVPTCNLASQVEKSETLKHLVKLGVDLSRIERRKGLAEFVLKLDYERDIKQHLFFLTDTGVSPDTFGEFITKNPLIFREELDDLQVRVNYLKSKQFSPIQISRIITKNPFWLMFSTQRIDKRLGFFQDNFNLSGDDVRFLASKQPRLITYNMEHIRKCTFSLREEMGFDGDETRRLLMSKPKLWMTNPDEVLERFAYAHNKMKLSHDMFIKFPEILLSREFRIRERHEFLKKLGRAQYDPTKDLYISPKRLIEGNDREFARNVAKSKHSVYQLFLKSL